MLSASSYGHFTAAKEFWSQYHLRELPCTPDLPNGYFSRRSAYALAYALAYAIAYAIAYAFAYAMHWPMHLRYALAYALADAHA